MLIYDIETKVLNNNINPNTDEFRTIAIYDVDNNKYHFYTNKDINIIKNVFKKHKVIIGHNNIEYDNVVLKRYNILLKYHTLIDTLVIARKRALFLGIKYEKKSLSNLAKFFKLKHYKDDDFNYDVLQKKVFTNKDLEYIKNYNINDVIVTYELYMYFANFFEPFKEFISDYNNLKFNWLTSSIASYAYKAICYMCDIKEEYNDSGCSTKYTGGFVTEPIQGYANNVILFDFASLYPHVFSQCNLFSPVHNGWTSKDIGMKGEYNKEKQGKIEKLLMKLYKKRIAYKDVGDKREYVIKIILNSIYGASANPVFKNIYNRTGARDCTAISRYCIKTAIKMFTEFGYNCLYTDTDSVYIELRNNQTKEMATQIAEIVVEKLQKQFLFQESTFKLKIDDEIKHIYFFKKNNRYLKKMYIYVTNNNKLIIKGLPMIKNDSSKIGYYIFKKYMKESLKKGEYLFNYKNVKKWLNIELKNNPLITARTFTVKEPDLYKNKSQLQYQISKKYGSGTHKLITNNLYGVGKSKHYCLVKEYKEQGLVPDNIDTSKFWSEIRLFIKNPPSNKIIGTNQLMLSKWGGI